MNMQETEQDILQDLLELGDSISQYTYLITCAEECILLKEEDHTEENLIRDCQVNTWMQVIWKEEKLYMEADSESLIIKGALALLQEIYDGRTKEEILVYRCGLMEREEFTKHFTRKQRTGLKAILDSMKNLCKK